MPVPPDDNHLDPQDIADDELHELIEGEHVHDSSAHTVEYEESVAPDDDETLAAGFPDEVGHHVGGADEGQAEGFEESEELLVRAAEGRYRPPSIASRDGESDEALEHGGIYGEADGVRPEDL